ncbi:DinB family protein [Paenibacillus methanolicus]|uniref:DinB family protein n=1 Tax=Paenibacillus methanolicus TaxID=582686 RepID=A0A5S5C5C2_9BACL|nr:DinB family protein [Paenibacillus methanolicus]TYP74534.1 DinB family protein [Paenibacillus methanolicus]
MTQSIIHTGKVLRQIVIGRLQNVSESQMDIQPEGFSNTVRWHVGHMAYWWDKYASLGFGWSSAIPAGYGTFFDSGTKPSDWTAPPPTKEELMGLLAAQLSRLSEATPGLLEQRLTAPYEMGPFRFETSGELMNFAFMHEAIHLGVLSSQLKLIR